MREDITTLELGDGHGVMARCDGRKIEVLVYGPGVIFTKAISPDRALSLVHELSGFVRQMTDKRAAT